MHRKCINYYTQLSQNKLYPGLSTPDFWYTIITEQYIGNRVGFGLQQRIVTKRSTQRGLLNYDWASLALATSLLQTFILSLYCCLLTFSASYSIGVKYCSLPDINHV